MQVRVADFEEDFGGSSVPILLALHGPSVGESLETTRKATVALRDLGEDGPSRLSALTDLVPPSSVLTARCLELREIDRRSWRAEASEVAARHGLTGQALEPFFERLEVLAGLCDGGRQVEGARLAGPFAALWDRHVRELDSGAMSIVFVFTRERLEQVPQGWLEAVGGAGAEATWVFFNELSRAATDAMLSDVVLLGLAGLFLALALLRLLLGSVRAAGIVLITPLLALIGTVGLLGWLTPIQGPLPVVGLGSLLLVLGLGVDDGVYVVDALQEGRSLAPVRRAIGLTTLTSVIGFGALALAETPALRALGQVAVAGLILDLVVALYLVPRIWARRSAK